ncbi:hypothetical protein H2200_007767 [Cladophialophora chaetospira]|uniref:NAD(P)-binding protein n=1 Tax=Cladophialophora chaetospira TaxID=386627 RepID=A0AA38X6G4_9EURO|nr:hypothetical protein H2200_007767 [Cladophialophora chaetospira]
MLANTLVAIVVGAAGGIGKYTAEKLASRGVFLLLADINTKEVTSLATELAQRYNIRAEAFTVDITKEDEVKKMVETATSFTGRVDYAANCAGVLRELPGGHPSQTTLDVMKLTMAVNIEGLYLCQHYQAEQMKTQPPRPLKFTHPVSDHLPGERGAIVNVISVAGLQAVGLLAYTTSKYAGLGLTKEAAIAYGKHGIRVNASCPGLVETPMSNGFVNDNNRSIHAAAFAMGRASHPAEQANVLSFLLSDESRQVLSPSKLYMTGSTITNDGGYTDLKLPNYMELNGNAEGYPGSKLRNEREASESRADVDNVGLDSLSLSK